MRISDWSSDVCSSDLRPPDSDALARLSRLQGNGTALGRAHVLLAEAAGRSGAAAVEREYFDLFIGVGRGELLPYASYYLTGFLNERPDRKSTRLNSSH